jgi:hypothetical protein
MALSDLVLTPQIINALSEEINAGLEPPQPPPSSISNNSYLSYQSNIAVNVPTGQNFILSSITLSPQHGITNLSNVTINASAQWEYGSASGTDVIKGYFSIDGISYPTIMTSATMDRKTQCATFVHQYVLSDVQDSSTIQFIIDNTTAGQPAGNSQIIRSNKLVVLYTDAVQLNNYILSHNAQALEYNTNNPDSLTPAQYM